MSEKKLGKRLLTWVLVLVMTLSTLPLNVLADGDWESFAGNNANARYNISIKKGDLQNCTVFYSEGADTLSGFPDEGITHTQYQGKYGIVFFVKPADGYALTAITGTGSYFNSIVDTEEVTSCDFWLRGNCENLTNKAGFSEATITSLITQAKRAGCVAAFIFTKGQNDSKSDLNVILDFKTQKLPTFTKEIASCYDRDGNSISTSEVGIGDTISYKLTVTYYPNSDGYDVTYPSIRVEDELVHYDSINDQDSPFKGLTSSESKIVSYTIQANDINNSQITNEAKLTYSYKAKYNTASCSATVTKSADVILQNLVSYEYSGSYPNTVPSLPEISTHKHNSSVEVDTTVPTASVTGYTFSGWEPTADTASGVEIQNGSFTMPNHSVTFTGSWTANTDVSYTVKYLEEGTNAVLKDAKTVSGKTFNTTVTETAEEISGYEVVRDSSQTITLDEYGKVITFYYKAVQPTTVTLTFDANGGTWAELSDGSAYTLNESKDKATQKVAANSRPAVVSPIPVKSGFTFDGWYLENDRLYVNFVPVGNSDMTLVARWKPTTTKTYTVIYTDGLTANKAFNDQSTSNLSLGDETPKFVGTPTRSGYVFTGWTPTVAETVKAPEDGSTVITYTATWEVDNWNSDDNTETGGDGIPDKYQALVNFLPGDPNGEVSGKTTQVITMPRVATGGYASAVKLGSVEGFEVATTLPNDGFKFNVWTMNKATDENEDEAKTAVTPKDVTVKAGSKTTFFAHFKSIPTYTVTYTDGVNSEEVFADQVYTVKSGEPTPAFSGTPTRDGYTFAGWDSELAETVTEDVTYTAQWTPIEYTVTYKVDGTQVGDAESYHYGDSVIVRDKYQKTGYTVSDWSSADVTFTSGSFSMPAKNVVINATSTTNTYTVTWMNYDGTVLEKDENVPYGTTPKYNSATPTRPASGRYTYTFKSWDKELTPVTGDVIYTATYTETYHRPSTPPSRPTTPTVEIDDDDALGLNTTDHFAYIVGYGNGEVRPQNNITRAEVATIFFRLLTDDVRDANLSKTNRYSDVADTAWYNTAVSTLSAMGIITGYPDGTFRPNAAITRAEFAAIAARFDTNGDKTTAAFTDIASHWAKDEISIAANNGWIKGYEDNTFRPQRDITRAETMTLVNRVLNRQPETEDDLLPNMTVWTDNADKNAWYYLAVQEATNSHYYEFKTNSQYEKWTELRETRDWTQLEK